MKPPVFYFQNMNPQKASGPRCTAEAAQFMNQLIFVENCRINSEWKCLIR